MPHSDHALHSARLIAARALARAAAGYPDIDPVPLDLAGIDHREAHLALAIQRTTLQRWLTIEFLLDQPLRQPMRKLQPALRGLLLTAGAQILFMDRLPAYAVVDESVALARKLVRKDAAGLTNAVLRRLADMVKERITGQPWTPAPDRIPTESGYLVLAASALPDPAGKLPRHLALATSHPVPLVQRWLDKFGREAATALCLHNLQTPPLIVAVEERPAPPPIEGLTQLPQDEPFHPHETPGFIVWNGSHDELIAFLKKNPARRVQDPASALPVGLSAELKPTLILDYCAGRGTKARQAALLHPHAQVVATDVHPQRLASLREMAKSLPNLTATASDQLQEALAGRKADLLMLDVPCTNTAVLARRPEARYRFCQSSLDKLLNLQRQIISQAAQYLAPTGYVLYSTCSLEESENQRQAHWMQQTLPGHPQLAQERSLLPAGTATTYHDGSYAALLAT